MEKVICDVCGTDYPETAAQCPICGCARGDGGQTSARNNAAAGEERPAYTYTKGGRFSKANVRKRLKAAQIQQVPVNIPEPEDEPDYDDYDEEDELDEAASNRGLIAIVILLLLAIIAVSSYIAIVHFDLGGSDTTNPVGTTGSVQTTPSQPTSGGVQIPCTKLTVDSEITLVTVDSVWQLSYTVEPIDTTDQIQFVSNNKNVAIVDASGRVTAVGNGEATITITCGTFVSECKVVCNLGGGDDPTDPSDPTVPTDPVVELKLNRSDITMKKKGESWNLYSGELSPAEITWTSADENIATIVNGKVVAVAPGRTTVYAEYEGQKVSCIIRCSWTEETQPSEPTEPTEPSDPVDPSEPSEPSDPVAVYYMKVNNVDPHYVTGTDACEVSIKVGESFLLAVVDKDGTSMGVTWNMSTDGIVTVSGKKVTGAAGGKVTLTATCGEQTFTCVIRVSA